ncbi:MAG: DEAD/DEAH box helicase [Pseudomonadota bacterium]|nr:DEAD/DEAH box helicase [Pseudomonadota bacterium]
MPTSAFHPAVHAWFTSTFPGPTPAQRRAWPEIKSGRHALIAAPTGSGKTLAAFLAAIDDLVWRGMEGDLFGALPDETHVVYVSPLKALSNDIRRNLEAPLSGIRDQLTRLGYADIPIRAMVRTGDTTQADRDRIRRRPPHILVTTPESLYIMLTSDSGRRVLSTARTVIVDEIHALAGNKRGAHLALSLERLESISARGLIRIGLSATQKPLETVERFLIGAREASGTIVDAGHERERDLAVELTASPLDAVMSAEAWAEIHERLCELIEDHRTTLIFVNTRRLAERLAKALSERIGEQGVTSHHGSLAREHRLDAEQRLKSGGLRALVATASLELGIDIGDVDLVCQIGSPRAISTFLQRVGRSGHAVGATPKGRLFPTSRDELVECVALVDAIGRGELDALCVPPQPLDVLSQQIVAETACAEQSEDDLFTWVRRAWPYRDLARGDFDAVVRMLADGFSTRRGRRGAWIHRDAVNRRLRARRGAKLTAVLNGGAIPDLFDYDVILQPQGSFVGTLNEDFAFESLPGDIFQLGNTSYRILKTETGKVHVEDAHGQPPNIPFWFGEAPGRSDELSAAVSRLRHEVDHELGQTDFLGAVARLERQWNVSRRVAEELIGYLAAARAALGTIPCHETIVLERFFDEAGDQHLVLHSPFGSRLNRAWGLALRKRFCRKFNFELQAAALEDTIVLSLGSTHSFPLEEAAHYLKSATVRDLLVQALLDAPMFPTHWRWNATISLAVRRNRAGGRVPPQFQRMDAEDLVAVVFPDQIACLENVIGKREVPDHPLVNQTLEDCLHAVMDIDGLEALLARIEKGEVSVIARDLTQPSPLAREVLTANPYAFLDDAPAEERRTQMVRARRYTSPEDVAALGSLDAEAIGRVREEAWPVASNADELHEALMLLGVLTVEEGREALGQRSESASGQLFEARRATAAITGRDRQTLWICAERLADFLKVHPDAATMPQIDPAGAPAQATREAALRELVRGRLEASGPVTGTSIARVLQVDPDEVRAALIELESEGFAMRGTYSKATSETEWCERGLLARIHRYTVRSLRDSVRPVPPETLMRFLFRWQRVHIEDVPSAAEARTGEDALADVLEQLEGWEAQAAAWESAILPLRVAGYRPSWLDGLCVTGRRMWARLGTRGREPPRSVPRRFQASLKVTPVSLVDRRNLSLWWVEDLTKEGSLSGLARRVAGVLESNGASFFDEIVHEAGLLPMQAEEALSELAVAGLATSDTFAGLRALMVPPGKRGGKRRGGKSELDHAGRWVLVAGATRTTRQTTVVDGLAEEHEPIVRALLRRYGIVFRRVIERETRIPPWRELLYVLRRLEARGEIRGGRFVDGFSGEQFALPEAAGLLREVHRDERGQGYVTVSGADPLNQTGIVTPGVRVPALASNRVLYRGGIPVAALAAGRVELLDASAAGSTRQFEQMLLDRHGTSRGPFPGLPAGTPGFHRSG